MTGEIALLREQGQTFAVLAVKPHVVQSPPVRQEWSPPPADGSACAPPCSQRTEEIWGPNDIVRWLQNIHVSQLPWRKFTV